MISIKNTLRIISYWPPFLAAGISVKEYDLEKGYIVSKLKRTPFNGNAFGTHFGGSLYAMCDPWYVFLAIHSLGKKYIVWDIEAQIKYKRATKDPVYARFDLSKKDVEKIKLEAKGNNKVFSEFSTEIRNERGDTIAEVKKTIYVRRKIKSF